MAHIGSFLRYNKKHGVITLNGSNRPKNVLRDEIKHFVIILMQHNLQDRPIGSANVLFARRSQEP